MMEPGDKLKLQSGLRETSRLETGSCFSTGKCNILSIIQNENLKTRSSLTNDKSTHSKTYVDKIIILTF